MPREVTCPSCKNRLLVPPGSTEKWLTCPRCLCSIGNPNVLITSDAPHVPEPRAVEPAEEPRPPRTCPSCEQPVERGWRFCPYCEEELRRPRRSSKAAALEDDVTQDTTGGMVVAIVLGGLLLLGIIVFFVMDGPRILSKSKDGWVFGVGGVVLVLVLIGSVAVAIKSRNKTASLVSGVVGGVTFGVGLVGLVVLLACLAIMAAINDFFNTCAKGCH